MKTGKIQISDKDKIAKLLNSKIYLFIFIGLLFLVVDYDLFSSQPMLLKTEGVFWKAIAIAFQLLFVTSFIKWEIKRRSLIEILHNGIVLNGNYKFTERIKPNKSAAFYLHLFEYQVADKTYEVTLKNKSKNAPSSYIIYQFRKPSNGIVFDELNKDLKELVKRNIK